MDDQLTSMLAYAAGMPRPLTFSVRTADGRESEHEFAAPYLIIGRGAGSDLQLAEQTVSFRHAYLQVIGSRVAYVDLLSVAGIQIAGPPFHGWLSTEHEISIGSTRLRLLGPEWNYDEQLPGPLDFRPRDDFRMEYGTLPQVELELLNTAHQGKKWPINRVITLIGRDDRCRITVADDRLSRVQCALLLLPTGLWIIDLMGKGGVQLNGHAVQCGFLAAGSVLEIGPYQLSAHYQSPPPQPSTGGGEFVTRSNRIFPTDFYHNTIIVSPAGDQQQFYYQDVHAEASRVCDLFLQKGFQNLVIHFGRVEQLPHIVLEGLMSMCRVVPGRTVTSQISPQTAQTLQSSAALRALPEFPTLPDALQAIYA